MSITNEEQLVQKRMFDQMLQMRDAEECFFKLARNLNRAKIDASESTIKIIESVEGKVNKAEAQIANELILLWSEYKLKYSVRLINRVMKRRLRSIRQVTPRKVEINTSSFRWDRYNDNLRNKIANH
jgi:hypothetical protein